jgi:hypothetical protein
MGEELAMDMRDRRWRDPGRGFADEACASRRSTAEGYVLDDDAVVSVISHASRLIASSLEPIGRGLFAGGEGGALECGGLIRAAIQIDAVNALYRRLSRPRHRDLSLEDHCRCLCCDLVLALGRLDVTSRVAMCDAPLSPHRDFRLAILVVEVVAGVIGQAAPCAGATIWVTLAPSSDGRLELSISDNLGARMSPDPAHPRRFETLIEALAGEWIAAAGPTHAFRLRFPAG